VEAAVAVFAERGVEAATLEQICATAGFTRGAFYANFESKDELLAAALVRLHEQFFAEEEQQLPATASAEDYLAYLRTGRRDAEAHWDWVRPIFVLTLELLLAARRQGELMIDVARFYELYRGARQRQVEHILRNARRRPPADPALLAAMIVAIEDGLHLQTLVDPAAVPPTAQFDALTYFVEAISGLSP
jgi:AcrR family transcriptional regulator